MHTFQNPEAFLQNLVAMNDSIFQIMELSREQEAKYPNPVFREMEIKNCYQVAGQFHRPEEFLESLVDMIRVTFQTKMFGTLLLNSNPAYFYDSIPKEPFILGYISEVSKAGESFSDFWVTTILKKLEKCDYSLERASTIFVSVAAGQERMSEALLNDVSREIRGGFGADEFLRCTAAEIKGEELPLKADVYTGYVWDNNLLDRLRVSLWLFIEETKLKVIK
jgi:hypothetical protein